jgi:hypothetical protein
LQFDYIRSILREESQFAATAKGVFGNAQQPVMVLPNIYFFARGASDLDYLNKTNEEILTDLADFLGGSSNLLVPAWDCFQRDLESLPADLPQHLRSMSLTSESAQFIPGGPERYLEILAQQAESRIKLLQAIATPADSDEHAAKNLADGITALVNWWNVHQYTVSDTDVSFKWNYVHNSQVLILAKWCRENVKDRALVAKLAADILSKNHMLPETQALQRVKELISE